MNFYKIKGSVKQVACEVADTVSFNLHKRGNYPTVSSIPR